MPKTDPRVDAYIARSAPYAQPILKHLRKLVHRACPDVVETIKWQMPFFDHEGPIGNMAAFKAHCTFGLWKQRLLATEFKDVLGANADAMGSFGRITSLRDLPNDAAILACVRAAVRLNAEGVKTPRKAKSKTAKSVAVPKFFLAALKTNARALAAFEAFSPSHRREYVAWVTEAKTDATRDRRMATALTWIAEGKSRNWKYER